MSSGAAATILGMPTCGATACSTPARSPGVQPASSALPTCHRYDDGGASSAISTAILTSEKVRGSRPLFSPVLCCCALAFAASFEQQFWVADGRLPAGFSWRRRHRPE